MATMNNYLETSGSLVNGRLVDSLESLGMADPVKLAPSTFTAPDGSTASVDGKFAVYRHKSDGSIVGYTTVGKRYEIVQDRDICATLDEICDRTGAEPVSYFTEGRGAVNVVSLLLPGGVTVGTDDESRRFVHARWSHDGSGAIDFMGSLLRLVCTNQLPSVSRNAAKSGAILKIRHTSSAEDRLKLVAKTFENLFTDFDRAEDEVKRLAERNLSETERAAYFESLFPTRVKDENVEGAAVLEGIIAKSESRGVVDDLLDGHFAASERSAARNANILSEIVKIHDNSRNSGHGVEGSAWAAYNAVSEWTDHVRTVPGAKTVAEERAKRATGNLYGTAADVKVKAYDAALALAV